MNDPMILQTLRIELRDAAAWLSRKLSVLLEREIICEASADDYDYWALKCLNDRFSLADLCRLLSHVNVSKEMIEVTIPADADSCSGIDVSLCNVLLQEILHTEWNHQLVQGDAVYLIGINQDTLMYPPFVPNVPRIGSLRICSELLMGKEELLDALSEDKDKNNCSSLAAVSERNIEFFGNELYWQYPLSDDMHNGMYFVLVREGVLCIPYDRVEEDVYEILLTDEAHLCNSEEMQNYIDDWPEYSSRLSSTMRSLQENIILKELENDKT